MNNKNQFGPTLDDTGQVVGHSLDMSSVHHRADSGTNINSHSHSHYRQLKVASLPNLHMFELWEEGGKNDALGQ